MNKDLFAVYARLKQEEKAIQEKIELLVPDVFAEIEKTGGDKVESEKLGTFSIEKRKVWKFSEDVKSAEKKFKELQIKEKADGTATFIENKFVKYYPLKETNG